MTNEETKNLEENIKRYIGVLMENMDGKFKLLADGQQILERKFDSLSGKVDTLSEKTDLLIGDMDYVKSVLTDNREWFKESDSKIDQKADKEVVNDHETRISRLENGALVTA